MTTSILVTKLYIPPTRPEIVPRPRLIERLDAGLHRKLTLISAPAGFGKTTLVTEWLDNLRLGAQKDNQIDNRIAWLSLDKGDNDPARFLTYFITALNQIEGINTNFGKGALSMLQSPQSPPTETILTSLINEFAEITDKFIFVLDDYHLIDAQPIHEPLTFLLEHLPPRLHLVIATREDPHLPLSRMRASGQLTELRAVDLRFTSSEAAEFLNQVMGLNLSTEDIAALETRTEGWIAGLQLAAISLQGREDTTELIKSFSGSHRLVLDYLIEEVLEQQSESIQSFLLQTAILDRLTGSLCDALTGQDNAQRTLEYLEQANLFIVPLDEERRWYRYHHLFADLLRQRLNQIQPEQVSTLHRRAGTWYEDQDLAAEALRHIFVAGDFKWAGRLVEQVGTVMFWKGGNWTKIQNWLEKFPKEVMHSRPKLCLLSAWIMHFSGQPEAVEPFLLSVESHLQDVDDGQVARADRLTETTEATSDEPLLSSDVQSMMAEVAHIRALTARVQGDLARAIELYQRALELLPGKELRFRALVIGGLADTYYLSADIAAASPLYAEALATSLESGNIYQALPISSRLAGVQVMQGHLHQAADSYQQMQHLFTRWGEQNASIAGYAYIGMGELMCEWNNLDEAVEQLREGLARGKQEANPEMLLIGYVTLTRALQALGDAGGALSAIQEAMRVWQQYPLSLGWGVPPVATYKARLSLAQGDVASTAQWVQEQGLRADGELSFQLEVDYITLARLLIAQGNPDEAVGLLQRLLEAAEAGGRILRVIEILLLQALSLQAQGNTDQAITTLEKALTLAEPEGFIRIFVDEGPPMTYLLYKALSRDIAPDYVRQLLGAFPSAEPEQADSSKTQDLDAEWIEPLSEREIDVLKLIAEGLTNQEIASRLYLSLHTVKVHAHNIYAKLGVKNRTQAVAKGKSLGILSPT
jgi:LuxR family maltose regulon positive regulatory protein